jgi:hypothetical protein
MSFKNPIECRNCGKDIYFDPPGVKGQPWDVETQAPHRCVGGSGFTNSKGKTPIPKPCKFDCGIMIVYDTKEGYYRENSMNGIRHLCENIPKESGQQLLTTPQKGSFEQIAHEPQIHRNPPIEAIKAQNATVPVAAVDLSELLNSLKEQNVILQGISAILSNIADNQDLTNRISKAIRDILNEYKEEVIDTIKKPPMKFESGNIKEPKIVDDDDDNDDVYDEFADTDDKTYSNE